MIFLNFAEIKNILELEKSEDDYPIIQNTESNVISAIEDYLNRKLIYGSYTEEFYASNNRAFYALAAIPFSSIDTLTIDGEVIAADDYQISKWGIKILYPLDTSQITVAYSGGYKQITDVSEEFDSIKSLPSGIHRALFLQTVYEYQNRDYIGASLVTNEGGTVTRPGLKLLDEVVRLLRNHKHLLYF
jgi:hypothetical protein